MSTTIVRYTTRPEHADQNQALVEQVFADLAAAHPAGLAYSSFRLADGVSFVHVATVDTEDGSNPLTSTPAFGEFLRGIAERCEIPPVASAAVLVGSYGSDG